MEFNTDALPLTDDPVLKLNKKNALYDLKKENLMLRMRLVKIMALLESVVKTMEKAKDGIVAHLLDNTIEIPTD